MKIRTGRTVRPCVGASLPAVSLPAGIGVARSVLLGQLCRRVVALSQVSARVESSTARQISASELNGLDFRTIKTLKPTVTREEIAARATAFWADAANRARYAELHRDFGTTAPPPDTAGQIDALSSSESRERLALLFAEQLRRKWELGSEHEPVGDARNQAVRDEQLLKTCRIIASIATRDRDPRSATAFEGLNGKTVRAELRWIGRASAEELPDVVAALHEPTIKILADHGLMRSDVLRMALKNRRSADGGLLLGRASVMDRLISAGKTPRDAKSRDRRGNKPDRLAWWVALLLIEAWEGYTRLRSSRSRIPGLIPGATIIFRACGISKNAKATIQTCIDTPERVRALLRGRSDP